MTSQAVCVFFPATVRERVLEQHRTLRALLRQSIETTTRSFQPDGPDLAALSRLVRDLRSRFWAHLTFEELTLLPVLAHLDLWGPERAQALREEHTRQRAELDTLVEGIASCWDVERLAITLRSLVTDLLLDMDEEESGCLSAELLRDEMLVVGKVRE